MSEKASGCRVASQCRKTLAMLSGLYWGIPPSDSFPHETDRVTIPYFGTVVRRPWEKVPLLPVLDDANWNISGNDLSSATMADSGVTSTPKDESLSMFSFDLEYMADTTINQGQGGDLGNPAGDHLFPWFEAGMMDLDQDWALFSSTSAFPSGNTASWTSAPAFLNSGLSETGD